MARKPTPTITVSSPASTGGAGTFFEQHVGAFWLSLLLVRGIPPIITDCTLSEVHFQTERLGWHTDDFLVVGENGIGARRQLVGQVKRAFSVSSSDPEFQKAIQDFWRDFRSTPKFIAETDRLLLVVLRGTNTLLEFFSGLLDCSRSARSSEEFEQRLKTKGLLNARAIRYYEEIKKVICQEESREITSLDLWPFLKVLHVVSFDLNTPTAQSESLIKSLLAYTITDHAPIEAAEATWNALLCEVGQSMPEARSFTRDALPEKLRHRHSCLGGNEKQVLRALADHTNPILKGIRCSIGVRHHLPRAGLAQSTIDQLELSQVVLLSGPAGSGKSGIAKTVVESLAKEYFVFAFRAEEFKHASLDTTLQQCQIPANAARIGAILSGQTKKLMLIESVERLLEASTRDAFKDLLSLIKEDRGWRVILTCRDYSMDIVRSSFLAPEQIDHLVVGVPPLSDSELDEVNSAYPVLTRPLSSVALKGLLRNPYMLDKSLLINWDDAQPLPSGESGFRKLFWREVVRAEHNASSGMPARREEAFVAIALRRARALNLFASCEDLDPTTIDGLHADSLIMRSKESNKLVAPTHDVLEDWAILHWMTEQYAVEQGSVVRLSEAVGGFPAIRRTYRKWVEELIEQRPADADALFLELLSAKEVPNHFSDDTIVAFLRSASSESFLQRHQARLIQSDKQSLRRVIHLLRVACVANMFGQSAGADPVFSVPDGPAWAAVLQLVARNLATFNSNDNLLLLGLVEDWARGVSWQTPNPQGAESAASISYHLLPRFDGYGEKKNQERLLTVISRIPTIDRARFIAILHGRTERGKLDSLARELRCLILEDIHGMAACRDLPDIVIDLLREDLILTDEMLKKDPRRYHSYSLQNEPLFGLKDEANHGYFPPSAYRGPFRYLLRYHPRKALDFLIELFNHSADWYRHPRIFSDNSNRPTELTLVFADGFQQEQVWDLNLWHLYRGTSVGPYVLQCALMAIEHWLLDYAKSYSAQIDTTLLELLRRSKSSALTAVVASIATAHPHASAETLLVLLGCKECVQLDRGRLSSEHGAASIAQIANLGIADNRVWNIERNQSNALPHRSRDLEAAILNLQLGPIAPRVHDAIDKHHRELRPVAAQSLDDKIWRIALQRMDLRRYSVDEEHVQPAVPISEEAPANAGTSQVYLSLKSTDADIQEMSQASAARLSDMNRRMALFMWGISIFRKDGNVLYNPSDWRSRLTEAMTTENGIADDHEFAPGKDSQAFVAAVCVRDHWDELVPNEQQWCVELICSEVERTGSNWDHFSRSQRGGMTSNCPAARSIASLVGKSLTKDLSDRVNQSLAVALTHSVDEVRWFTAFGIAEHLWTTDRPLALRCVNTLAAEAIELEDAVQSRRKKLEKNQRESSPSLGEIEKCLRIRFFEESGIPSDAWRRFDPSRSFGAEAAGPILVILGGAPNEAVTIEVYTRVAQVLTDWWESDANRRKKRIDRSYETESGIIDLLASFLFVANFGDADRILQPIYAVFESHPREVARLVMALVGIEDKSPKTERFWQLWQLLADRVHSAKWLCDIDDAHSDGSELISALFLGPHWKEHVRNWRSLEGHSERIHSFFHKLPVSADVMEFYLRLLFHVGEQSLPAAFEHVAARLKGQDERILLSGKNTAWYLEGLLRRFVYSSPLALKRQRNLRDAILYLLDLLVEVGSSSSFRMRDDFVTPIVAERTLPSE